MCFVLRRKPGLAKRGAPGARQLALLWRYQGTGASHDVMVTGQQRCPFASHATHTQGTTDPAMSHYLREHLDAVGELPEKLRETMGSIGQLDDRVTAISALIDSQIGEVARARQRYYAQFESGDSGGSGSEGQPPRAGRAKVCGTPLLLSAMRYF